MAEEWRQVKECPDYYVSNMGRVKSYRYPNKGRILVGVLDKDGYKRVLLRSIDGARVTKFIHRLVAEAFLSNPNNFSMINHKDENRQNNRVDNLEWCTARYNNTYGNRLKKSHQTLLDHHSKFAGIPIIAYKNGVYKEFESYAEGARELNLSIGDIQTLVNHGSNNYKHLRSLKGWQFAKKNERYKINTKYKSRQVKNNKVIAIKGNTRKIFNSRAELARWLDMDSSYICKCVRNEKVVHGWLLKDLD